MFTTQMLLPFLAVAVLSYLLGSLNFAIIISGMYAKGDIRQHGSGNAGMTNILRTYGKGPAIGTAAGDFLKGVLAVTVARFIFARCGITVLDVGYVAGLFVLFGHLFPLYFGFKGGKGVMTMLGVIFVINPLVFLVLCVLFVPVVFISKIVSLASILGAVIYPVLTWLSLWMKGNKPVFETVCAALVAAIILFMHRENIKRLLNGTENRFGSAKK